MAKGKTNARKKSKPKAKKTPEAKQAIKNTGQLPARLGRLVGMVETNSENINTMHGEVEKRFREILSTQAKTLDYIADSRKQKRKMLKLEKDVKATQNAFDHRTRVSDYEAKELQDEIKREFKSLNSIITSELKRLKENSDKLELELRALKERVKDISSIEEQMKETDISSMRREIETLKTKNEWIEAKLDDVDILPLERKMSSLERKIKTIRESSPIIIE